MSFFLNERFSKEFKDLTSAIIPDWLVEWNKSDDQCDLRCLKFFLIGRRETPYENGKFQLSVKFSTEYPYKCPEFQFNTKIFHPNVGKDGFLSMSFLDNYLSTTSMRELLRSIAAAIHKPNKDDIRNREAALLYYQKPALFERRAATWAAKYAFVEKPISNVFHTSSSSEIIFSGRGCLSLPHLYAASPYQRSFQPIDHFTRECVRSSSNYATDEKLIIKNICQLEKPDVIKTENITPSRCETILKQFTDVQNNMEPEWCVELYYPNDLNRWRLYWSGRDRTPYEKGRFQLSVKFPAEYPFGCPEFRFDTQLFHPNVEENGSLFIPFFTRYLPTTSMCELLQSIADVICNPYKEDAVNQEVALFYEQKPALFEQIAAFWTRKYANEDEIISDTSDSSQPSEMSSSRENSVNSTRASSPLHQGSCDQIDQDMQKLIEQLYSYTTDEEVIPKHAYHQKSPIVEPDGASIVFSDNLEVFENYKNICHDNRNIVKRGKRRRRRRRRQRCRQPALCDRQIFYDDPFLMNVLDASIDTSIANVVTGIRIEGSLRNQELNAEKLVRKLQTIDQNDTVNVGLECIKQYARPTFLYKSVNRFLRKRDYSKLKTLGPYCKLLYSQFNDGAVKIDTSTVYRGNELRESDLRAYKRGIGKKPYRSLEFLSTSKNKEVAKKFIRNAFFIIHLEKKYNDGRALDITTLSGLSEEEVLIRPGVEFAIEKFEYDEGPQINTFYLTAYI